MKKLIRRFFNALNYDIVKLNFYGTEKYKKESAIPGLNYYENPLGKYYLPIGLKKDLVANCIKSGIYFEPDVIEFAKKYIKDGTAVLDVGANYGQMSICFSQQTPNGKVYSFEAEPVIADILKKNIEANQRKNIQVVEGAVYHVSGNTVYFPLPDFKRFDSYGSYGIDPNASEGRAITTLTIDSLQIAEPVSFMKVDIQGSDLFALQGARETIMKNRMPILFEYEEQFQEEFKTSFNDYVEFVRSINYRFVSISKGINYLILPNEA